MTARLANPAAAADPRRTWYGTQIWKTRRAHQLQIEPLCAICEAEGRVTPATVADHNPPCGSDYNKFVLGSLRSLCKECHDGLQPAFKHKPYSSAVDDQGYPLDPRHPFNRGR
jgi:5-methylcytosine-specific restriction enzyme A